MFQDILTQFAANGVRMVCLDAVGYVLKKPGTVACPEDQVCFRWTYGEDSCTLYVDLGICKSYIVSVSGGDRKRTEV